MSKAKELIEKVISEAELDGNELAASIEQTIKKYFPRSWMDIRFSSDLYPSISGRFTVGNKSDWGGGIMHNDVGFVTLV